MREREERSSHGGEITMNKERGTAALREGGTRKETSTPHPQMGFISEYAGIRRQASE